MNKEFMDGQTILFKSDSFCKAYHLKYFNENYTAIAPELGKVKEIYYKCKDSRASWINYRQAVLSKTSTSNSFKVQNAPKLTDLSVLPTCDYVDAYGFTHVIGARDGLDSPSAIKSRTVLKPINFDMSLSYEMINEERKYRLTVNFKADITNSIIIFNGCYYPYHVNSDKISVTYYEEDGVAFPQKMNKKGNPVRNEDGSVKVFDPKQNREYYNIIPYAWANVKKNDEFKAVSREDDWIVFDRPITSGCILFYNYVMYFYEINKFNDHMVKILEIDSGNTIEFDRDDIRMIEFVNTNRSFGELKQQKMVGLFQVDSKDAEVYFPSSVSDGIITYNGINETYLINPDKKSLRFMMPHETYGLFNDLLKTISEGSVIHCINFYTGDIDGSTYTMPHDELTGLANNLINKYKTEAKTANKALNDLQEKIKLIYPHFKDTIKSYKMGEFDGTMRPYFILKYKPIVGTITLFIDGVAYKEGTYCYYHLLDDKTPIVVWDYLAMDNGFDIKSDFDITAFYDVLYSDNPNFNESNN